MKYQKYILLLIRLAFGWLFLYSGVTKIFDPAWTSAGYLQNAQTFSSFYDFLSRPDILPTVDVINAWGQAILGVCLLTGQFISLASLFGVILMLLYYFPVLKFPHPDPHAYIVDQHIIYTLVLLLFTVKHWPRKPNGKSSENK